MQFQGTRSSRVLAIPAAILAGALAATCRCDTGPGEAPDASLEVPDAGSPAERCALDLNPFFERGPGSTLARPVESEADLVGGPNAQGHAGDFLIANDRVRVVIQGPDRHIGASPYGGTLLDADLVRAGPGQDQFGELGLLYNLGRTVDATRVEVLASGGAGAPAVIAASGRDAMNDYMRIKSMFRSQGQYPVLDGDRDVPLRITTYYVLNPGEPRVRLVTAFCNDGGAEEVLAAGDVLDPGWTVELFNGRGCTGGFGYGGLCAGIDSMSWFGYQGDGVAYGYAPYRLGHPSMPEPNNAMLTVSAVSGTLIGVEGVFGMTDWFDPDLPQRSGELRLAPGETRAIARDFVVGRDIGEVASLIETWRAGLTGTPTAPVLGRVNRGVAPAAGARVAFVRDSEVAAVFVTDDSGNFRGELPRASYQVSAWAPGSRPTPEIAYTPAADGSAALTLELQPARRLRVSVREPSGAPLPAKVTVLCALGTCAVPQTELDRFTDVVGDKRPENVELIGFVPPSGEASFELPPDTYHVLVSRGPEYSISPNDFPQSPGHAVDLREADASVEATLARVLDTTGYVSADFHVHAVNSSDSNVDNLGRVLSFAAEGVDLLVSTDHDYITDMRPFIEQLGAGHLVATLMGNEISTMDYGHYNAFPMTPDPSSPTTRGAIDWAGGRGPTLTPAQLFDEAFARGARTVVLNHPRGLIGGFTHMRVDTDTLATHTAASDLAMAPQPGATAADSKLLSNRFQAYEILNGVVDDFDLAAIRPQLNDWFTLLSRGLPVAGLGGSDTHRRFSSAAGYWRTWVGLGVDAPQQIEPFQVSAAVNALKAVASNGPFVRVRAERIDASGAPTSTPAGPGECLAASAGRVRVTVEAQAPEYLDLTRVELYTHRPEDDARCPIDPASPQAQTTRVACDGQANRNWPQASIAASANLVLSDADKVVAASSKGVEYRRWQASASFELDAPATDNWIVAMVYGSKPMFPLVYPETLKLGRAGVVTPFAVTNPIFVDADGGGFDKAPFKAMDWAPRPPPPPQRSAAVRAPTPVEVQRAWRAATRHGAGAH